MDANRLSVRPAALADARELGWVHVESWRSTYAGLLPDQYLASLDVEERAGRWLGVLQMLSSRQSLVVAEHEGTLVGFAYGGPERDQDSDFLGELYAIYLVRSAQGKGGGRSLLRAVAADLDERGMGSMLVWVLRDNLPARGFYEHMGGVYAGKHMLSFEGLTVPEVAYGWPDLRRLQSVDLG
jgi:GNAT superfamily N-acetyltransferase